MRIAIDAMGGDGAPGVPVQAAVEALDQVDGDFDIALVGDPDAIQGELSAHKHPEKRLEIVPARDVITMDDPPVASVRAKPDSSLVRGVRLQESGEADGFISAGSTGAILAASILILGPLPGVDRPAIGALLPSAADHPTLMLDVGGNVDSKPHQLVQFAHLGHIYVQDLEGRESPRIGLLSIGEESEKGDELTTQAFKLLQDSDLNFVGNAEGGDVISGDYDVVVCDGFVGNVVLKFYESVAGYVAQLISRNVADAAANIDLQSVCRVLDYTEFGGAPLLGVDGVTIICHGDSPARAIRNAVRVAKHSVERNMVEHLSRQLSRLAQVEA